MSSSVSLPFSSSSSFFSTSTTASSAASPREHVWPLPPFDGENVEVKPLAATKSRITFHIFTKDGKAISSQFPVADIVLKLDFSHSKKDLIAA